MSLIRLSIFLLLAALCTSMRTIDLGQGYTLGEELVDQNATASFCDSEEKALVSIQTMEEDILIHSLLQQAGVTEKIWTSGKNNGANRGFWRWGTGKPLYYNRWSVGDPDTNGDYCLYLMAEEYDRMWGTAPCTFLYLPLCEPLA